MLIKTHLAITIFFILLLISSVEYKLIFVVFAILATYVPDIDSRFSTLGSKKIARILQFFTKHRGMIHSFTFLFVLTFLIALFFPIASLGFFVGYASHLFADSFTLDGIKPFYPSKVVSRGKVATGGVIEKGILVVFVVLDVALGIGKIASVF
jgi:inner membrane protein|tara:strand:- start:4034 stop:4492 length:459 start_codon:yes stop_codon:yes gene_type:complete